MERLELAGFATESVGMFTLGDIREELRKPGRDPRDKFAAPVKPGMRVEGVVTSVTRFGAFADVGVHQDGLVHVSELANRFVKDPAEVVNVGQIVRAVAAAPAVKPKKQEPSLEDKLPAWKQ